MARETEVNGIEKISLIGTFMLLKKIISIEYHY
jgi:hypothetical protein